ncbi:MAG: dTDP-4-dehydrorhamnose reductase [Vulcanimicrobiaceae bacterium]
MRVAIVGSTGQLGTELVAAFAGAEVVALSHDRFDLESADALATLLGASERPDVVINTAAFHNVDRCELEPERAFALNAVAVALAARACERAGVAFAHVSTDYVFDGTKGAPYVEDDRAEPLNVYGISKLAGEFAVRRRATRHYVFRTSGLYAQRGSGSAKGKPFIERMLEGAEAGAPLRVVDDVTFSPSYARHVAAAIRSVVESGRYGTYHVTNGGHCTWHAFASEIVRQAGIDHPIARATTDLAAPIRRPAFSALEGRALARAGIATPPDWRDGIAAYLQERRARTTIAKT